MRKYEHDGASHLVSNMQYEAERMGTFPVLVGDEVTHFHTIGGGFDSRTSDHVVNFIHEIQGSGSPYRVNPEQASHEMEAHLENNYYNLDVVAVRTVDEYPEEPYTLSVRVEDYRFGPHSFSEALTANVDKRETRYDN